MSSRRSRLPRALLVPVVAAGVAAGAPGVAVAHDKLDHAPPVFVDQTVPTGPAQTGGPGAQWELVGTVPTGNPHTDIDFFTQAGESYAAVGTLAIGPNGGGQTIVQLTQDGEVSPAFFSAHPSATCLSDPGAALGLQHDVEVTPKSGDVVNNSAQQPSVPADAQLLIDATDASGRCHDQGDLVTDAPLGGLEIVDITDLADPVEIALTAHIGEAHTVNVDPRRPHIAYAVTSDSVSVTTDDGGTPDDVSDDTFTRSNETSGSALDGFEVVDLSSCLTAPYGTMPAGATLEEKRERCRPEVYRYRYPTVDMVLGHSNEGSVYGCHELEVYPDDRLTCGSGSALIVLDMSGAFEENDPSTPLDDTPRGTPLPCAVRDSSTASPVNGTGAKVVDCVTGEGGQSLTVSGYPAGNASLEGVEWVGSVFHTGRASLTGAATTRTVTEDIDFDHEAEFTRSGRNLIATDERGGGVTPPGATCSQGDPNAQGNGGIHAYRVDQLRTERPVAATDAEEAEAADAAYARGTDGAKAVFRAPIRTGAEGVFCTAHVMQQIPGQNRIFMGWYSQGTQVVDYVELPDGTFEWVEDAAATEDQAATQQAGWFIPAKANTWVSHVFRVDENEDGTFTYYGATGDFNLGSAGRNAIDVYKVTLPAPATACDLAPEAAFTDRGDAAEVHRRSIDCVKRFGIAGGATAETYAPGAEVTRGQMATFLANAVEAAGGELPAAPAGDAFGDIAGSSHRDAVNRLAAAGIVSGSGGSYHPGATVSRAQMASFVVRTAEHVLGQDLAAGSSPFADVPAGSTHAGAIAAGEAVELFGGTGAGTFSPDRTVPRDQMATFLSRLFERTIQP